MLPDCRTVLPAIAVDGTLKNVFNENPFFSDVT